MHNNQLKRLCVSETKKELWKEYLRCLDADATKSKRKRDEIIKIIFPLEKLSLQRSGMKL